MEIIDNDLIQAAAAFINGTSSHVFLTGKAGTGKTTFLRNLAQATYKNFVIVAPTGIAALNAGGVTIHSQFLLPLGTFLPDKSPSGHFSDQSSVYTQYTLSRKHPLNSIRRQVLRSIELLIIDEVSMLRADVLDAIDYRLRSVRGNYQQSFGGVQVLMIGDLLQLPPIVKDYEWNYLKRYYHSAHFFEAKALQEAGMIYIELDKIYRQSDNRFIEILNHLRTNKVTAEDVDELNRHYQPDISQGQNIITLTTHNYKAREINRQALDLLPARLFNYRADVTDEFPESMFPMEEQLELKVGARVMFIKNDTSGNAAYFNGKLATIAELSSDEIKVTMDDAGNSYVVQRDQWENKRYTVNNTTKELDEEVIGTFSQYPLRLAWAVTVHKSQGLTFDRAIVDVGSAFAPGQVYVALSRLRSLDGLILKTRIAPSGISSDPLVASFTESRSMQGSLEKLYRERQRAYLAEIIRTTFDFTALTREARKLFHESAADNELNESSMKSPVSLMASTVESEMENTRKFRNQLLQILDSGDLDALTSRADQGAQYYLKLLRDQMKSLLIHSAIVSRKSRTKSYLNALAELDQLLMKKHHELHMISSLIAAIQGKMPFTDLRHAQTDLTDIRAGWLAEARSQSDNSVAEVKHSKPKKKSGNKGSATKPDTVSQTLEHYKAGMKLPEIAAARSLALSTIEEHLARAAGDGRVEITDVVDETTIKEINSVLSQNPEAGLKALHDLTDKKHSFFQLKAVMYKRKNAANG